MRTILVQGELPPSDLAEVLPQAGVEVQSTAAYAFGSCRIAVFVGRKHYFRSNSYLGVVLVAATDGTTQRLDVGQAGAGAGLMGIEWGAGDDLEASVYNELVSAIQARGLSASG